MRAPFHQDGKPNGFLLLVAGLALFAGLLLALGPSTLQARLAVCGIGALVIGYGVFVPGIFWDQGETQLVRAILRPTGTRLLAIAIGVGVMLWGLLVPLP